MQYSIQKRTVVGGGANKTTFEMTINGYGHRDAIINATLLVLRGYDPKGDQKGCYVVQMANTPCMAFRITSPQKLAGVVGTGDLDNRLDDAGALKQYENLEALGDRLRDEIDAVLPIVTWATSELAERDKRLAAMDIAAEGNYRTLETKIKELLEAVGRLEEWQASVDLALRAAKRVADEPKIPWYRRLWTAMLGEPSAQQWLTEHQELLNLRNLISELESENKKTAESDRRSRK